MMPLNVKKNREKHMFRSTRIFTAALALLSTASVALADKVVISNWDGYMPKDMAEKFKAATGLELEVAVHATNEEIMGKVTASGGEGFDVLFVSSPFAEALNKLQLLSPIDTTKIPNLKNLYPEATQLQHDPGNAFSVPYAWGTTGLCYRSDLVKAEPTSWNDLLSPADDIKGKTTMLATDRWLMAAAFLADGMSVNTSDQASLDKVRDQLIATCSCLGWLVQLWHRGK
jgi:spermidine/putrescine transport system substrate-binding protein